MIQFTEKKEIKQVTQSLIDITVYKSYLKIRFN